MEIAFHTKSLRSLCEVDAVMRQKLGPIAAEALRVCLADLRAASSLSDIGASYTAKMTSSTDLEVTPTNGLEIVLRATAPKTKKPDAAAADWGAVTRVKIMEVHHRG
jgi:hypothetical protein